MMFSIKIESVGMEFWHDIDITQVPVEHETAANKE